MDLLDKYPRTKKAIEKTGMTIDELLIWSEKEIERLEKTGG